jgi:hypothetical protein
VDNLTRVPEVGDSRDNPIRIDSADTSGSVTDDEPGSFH